jgi:ribosomal protein S18 acetylase RimI-like enzyme
VSVAIRIATAADRAGIEGSIRSDETFRSDEIAVALELVDGSLGGDPDYQLRVAMDDHGVAGYLCFGRTPMTAAVWDLYWVVVHARARGQGIAAQLIRFMEMELRSVGGGHVRVETSETEAYGAARRLYEKLEYPEAARLRDFYRSGDALIVYYKPIQPTR